MKNYRTVAAELQALVTADEAEQLTRGDADYTKERERQAIVHAREDLVLLVSYASSLNDQLATVRRLLWLIAVLLAAMLFASTF